ncbi:MAG: putative DNA-binding domain-containing protein [Rubrivivax sp.]|nr:putative DNA-binding domain-containing protein [Rubrivivax sp.]
MTPGRPLPRTPVSPDAPTWQPAFAAALLDPDLPAPPGLRAAPGAVLASRLAVYRNNVAHSLIEVLGESFPVLRQWLGEASFRAMALRHLRERPPRSPLMHRCGEELAAWLASLDAAAAHPELSSLARLEWARLEAWQAADAEALSADELHQALADPETLGRSALRLHPALSVLVAEQAVVSLWGAHQHEDTRRDEQLAQLDLWQAEAALVLREHDAVRVLPLPVADAQLVQALIEGQSLGAALGGHPRADFSQVLALLLRQQLIVALQPAEPDAHPIPSTQSPEP